MSVARGPITDPALDRLWDAVAERLQRNGLSPRGSLTLQRLNQAERFALAGLIGRPVTAARARVDLAALDERVRRSGTAPGLVAAVSALRGPLVDRPGERTARMASREATWVVFRAELSRLGFDAEPWSEAWIDLLRPLVSRSSDPTASASLVSAARCIGRIRQAEPGRGRGELAASVTGDSHGLDDGSLVGTMVLRGLAAWLDQPAPASAEERRALWERAGVPCDQVATTVLTVGLRPSSVLAGVAPCASASISARSAAGCETHLTLRDLQRIGRIVEPGTDVFVCENPRVLEAALDAGSRSTIVCSSGNPSVVVTTLLARLVADGARLLYRGDFDWPGVAIANRVIERFGATPWRMVRSDYEKALAASGDDFVDLPNLDGRAVAASWDPGLAPAMERAGRVVHEERLLELLVADLS